MVVAGLLAFVLASVALRDRDRTAFVAVATAQIDVGTTIHAGQIDFVTVNVEDRALVARFVDGSEMQSLLDARAIASRSIEAGSVIADSDLRPPTPTLSGLRTMSLEVPTSRAVGGDLEPGDLIDVLDPSGENVAIIATGLEVVAVSTASGLGGGSITLSVSLDGPTALKLAGPSVNSELVVVRSTGAVPLVAADA